MPASNVKLIEWQENSMIAIITIGNSETRYSIRVPDDKNTEQLVNNYILQAADSIQDTLDSQGHPTPHVPEMNEFEGYVLHPM